MDTTVTAGLIGGLSGLVGAFLGAAGAVWGARLQLRSSENQAREERKNSHHDASFESAAQAVLKIKDIFELKWRSNAPENWEHQLRRELDRLRLASLSFEPSDLRERLDEGVAILICWRAVTHTRPDNFLRPHRVSQVVDHLITVLGEYRREGTLPDHTEGYSDAREAVFMYIDEQEQTERSNRENNI